MTILDATNAEPGARMRLGLAAVSAVALGAGLVAVVVPSRRYSEPLDVVGWLVGAVLVGAGTFTSLRQRRVAGYLLIASAGAWHLPELARLLPHTLHAIAEHAALVHVALLGTTFVVLAPRRLAVARPWVVLVIAVQLAAAASGWTGGWRILLPLAGAALLAVAAVGGRRLLPVPAGHEVLWVAAGATLGAELVGAAIVRGLVDGTGVERGLSPLHGVACAATAIMLAWSVGRQGRDDAVELGANQLATLPDVLASVLGVRSVEVALAADDGGWLTVDGKRVGPPAGHFTVVDDDSARPVALLGTDGPATGSLSVPARRALRLARDQAELRATLVGQVAELEASRRRILLAQDRARSEFRRALRAVPLTTLLAIERDIATWDASDGLHVAVGRARDNIEAIAADLDPVAANGSLTAALRTLVAACPASVEAHVDDELDVTDTVARTIWFAVSEALSNVVKHAPGARVRVTVEAAGERSGGPAARVRVCDDGPGGADPLGSGLRGLADRVGALGGSLRVDSPPAGGTALEVQAVTPVRARNVARLLGLGAAIAGIVVYVPRVGALHDDEWLAILAVASLLVVAAGLSVSGRVLLGFSAVLAAVMQVLELEGLEPMASSQAAFIGDAATPLIAPLLAICVISRRWQIAAALTCGIVAGPLRIAVYDPFFDPSCSFECAHNPFVVSAHSELAAVLDRLGTIGAVVAIALAIPAARHRFAAFAVLAAALASGSLVFGNVTPLHPISGIVVAAVLAAELAASASTATRLAAINRTLASSGNVQTTLSGALGDAAVTVAYVLDEDIDGGGPQVVRRDGTTCPPADVRRSHTAVVSDGRPLAWISHTSGAGTDVERLAQALNGSARLAFEIERLQATSAVQSRLVADSRKRLVGADEAERRRLERDIHDGAQQFVLSLGMKLEGRLAETADSDPIRSSIEINLARVRDTLDELRAIAHGLRPFPLEVAGLDAALRAFARRAPVPVTIRSIPHRRLGVDAESLLFAVVKDVVASSDGPLDVVVSELRGPEVELVVAGVAIDSVLTEAVDRVATAGGSLQRTSNSITVVVPSAS